LFDAEHETEEVPWYSRYGKRVTENRQFGLAMISSHAWRMMLAHGPASMAKKDGATP
jgi:hypothetical protein